MLGFKNLMVYRLTQTLDWSTDKLEEKLLQQRFTPCSPADQSKFGWGKPLKGSDLHHFAGSEHILLTTHKEEKILPATVVKQALEERITEIEAKTGNKLKKTEKQALKDDIVATLLPRAFSKHQRTSLYINTRSQLIFVNSSSAKRAEEALRLLRKTLGSLPVIPLAFAESLEEKMTKWLIEKALPKNFVSLDEAELHSAVDESVIRCKQQPLDSEEMLIPLQAGKMVSKLGLEWKEQISFILKNDGSLNRLNFSDTVKEQNSDISKEDYAQRFDADFILLTGIVDQLLEVLLDLFGGEKALI